MKRIRVLICDDSRLYRSWLSGLLAEAPDMDVVGVAEHPQDARGKIKELNPDVLTLDVEMPGMDGIAFLEKIMQLRPMPVVMVSTLTARGTDTAVRALQIGAVECVAKPEQLTPERAPEFAAELLAKIRLAASARVRGARAPAQQRVGAPAAGAPLSLKRPFSLIAIGASTGGVEAITAVLQGLAPYAGALPPIVITQHMPPGFTASFAARLDKILPFTVREAAAGQKLVPGSVTIAPGGQHFFIQPGLPFVAQLDDGPLVNGHKPAVDVMFQSLLQCRPERMAALILTGMGRDGAAGLKQLHDAGAYTLAQDEGSCVVYGMPKAAVALGAVDSVLPLAGLASAVVAGDIA